MDERLEDSGDHLLLIPHNAHGCLARLPEGALNTGRAKAVDQVSREPEGYNLNHLQLASNS